MATYRLTEAEFAGLERRGSDDTYALGDVIRVAMRFDDPVAVDTSGGAPRLAIDMDPADWGAKWASFASGSGTPELVFAYEVAEPNYSTQGIAVLADTLETNGGTIRLASAHLPSASWRDADLRHAGLGQGEGAVQIRIADGSAFDPAGGIDIRLPTVLDLRRRLRWAAELWPIDSAETKRDAARESRTWSC